MQSHFLIITGMSGAGKTQVVRTLEDLNFFCIDNLPATLIPKFAELCRQTSEEKVALVVDIRGGRFFDKLLQVLDEMEASGQKYELLFWMHPMQHWFVVTRKRVVVIPWVSAIPC